MANINRTLQNIDYILFTVCLRECVSVCLFVYNKYVYLLMCVWSINLDLSSSFYIPHFLRNNMLEFIFNLHFNATGLSIDDVQRIQTHYVRHNQDGAHVI